MSTCPDLCGLIVSSVHHQTQRQWARERERLWQAHERVKVLSSPPKNITQLPGSLFEVIQQEGGKRHTFSIALKHGIRQRRRVARCRLHFGLKCSFKWDTMIRRLCGFGLKFLIWTSGRFTDQREDGSINRQKVKSIRGKTTFCHGWTRVQRPIGESKHVKNGLLESWVADLH